MEADRREVPGLRPALGQTRGVEGEAEEDGGHGQRGAQPPAHQRLRQDLQRPDGVEDQGQEEVGAGGHLVSLSGPA